MYQTILINFFLGFLGFVFYSLWKSRIYFNSDEGWQLKLFLKENYNQWIFNSIFIIILCLVMTVNPESINFLKEITGLDLNEETINGGFFTVGFILSNITATKHKPTQKKIDIKQSICDTTCEDYDCEKSKNNK